MLGFISDCVESVCDEIEEFVDNPIGYTVDSAFNPVRNTADIIEGLSEGEIRTLAIAKLGADVVAGMAFSEIVAILVQD